MDITGNNLQQIVSSKVYPENIYDYRNECNALSTCMAFNSSGMLKSKPGPITPTSTSNLWIKESASALLGQMASEGQGIFIPDENQTPGEEIKGTLYGSTTGVGSPSTQTVITTNTNVPTTTVPVGTSNGNATSTTNNTPAGTSNGNATSTPNNASNNTPTQQQNQYNENDDDTDTDITVTKTTEISYTDPQFYKERWYYFVICGFCCICVLILILIIYMLTRKKNN
jgi:sensor c-di-GMP phosphodiesterase-like protein